MAPTDYYPNYYTPGPGQHDQAQGPYSYHAQSSTSAQAAYSQPRAPATSQSTPTYGTYQTDQYSQQTSSYGARPKNQWSTSYGGDHDGASHGRAAEALRSLSNMAYSTIVNNMSATTAASPQAATSAARYSGNQSDVQQLGYSSNTSYGQRTSRPKSVNAVPSRSPVPMQPQGLPLPGTNHHSQRMQTLANPPRAASSAQPQYIQSTHSQYPTQRPATTLPAVQYSDYNSGTVPATAESTTVPAPTSCSYSNGQPAVTPRLADSQTFPDQNDQSQTTVDPTAVYDPWPGYQRKLDAARAEEEAQRAAEEARREEQKRKQEAQKAEEARQAEEAKKVADLETAIAVPAAASQRPDKPKRPRQKKSDAATAVPDNNDIEKASPAGSSEEDLEAQIRSLMLKMRQYNSKDPKLLARIWEEERKTHLAGQSSKTSSQTLPKPAPVQTNESDNTAKGKGMAKDNATPAISVQSRVIQSPTASIPSQSTSVQQPPSQQRKPNIRGPTQPADPVNCAPGHPRLSVNPPATHPPTQSQQPAMVLVKQQSNTVWPQEKKGQLAATAAKWLNGIPENRGKIMSAEEISRMLDGNPSYLELCQKLEKMGLTLDRSTFARTLLSAVPDIGSTPRSEPPAQSQRPPASTTQKPLQASALTKGSATSVQKDDSPAQLKTTNGTATDQNPIHGSNGMFPLQSYAPAGYRPASQGPIGTAKYPPPQAVDYKNPYVRSSFTGTNMLPQVSQPSAPFAPMVQPVQASPPETRPKPASKEEAARKRNFSDIVDLTALSDDDLPPVPKKVNLDIIDRPLSAGPVPATQTPQFPSQQFGSLGFNPVLFQQQPAAGFPDLTAAIYPPSGDIVDKSLQEDPDIVKPINRRQALRRSTYNIKTIARDVLLATGKHPDMRPLNGHLEPLKVHFKHVDSHSDLSTFRWDLVDPGSPPKEVLNAMYQRNLDTDADADDEEEEDEERLPQPGPRTTTQPVSSGPGETLASGSRALETPVKKSKPRGRPPRNSLPMASSSFVPGSSAARPLNVSNTSNNAVQAPHGNAPEHPAPSNAPEHPAPSSAPKSAPSRSGGIGYSQFRQFAPDGTPLPKKRGRPVGWRKVIHGSAEAKANSTWSSQPSSLRNATNPVVVIDSCSPSAVPPPKYNIYKCLWKHCTAQLHNLETLRKHVHKLHGRPNAQGQYVCMWEKCGRDVPVGRHTERQEFQFASPPEWRVHLEQTHFLPLAWSLGDGPASGLSDGHDSEAYLSDAHGRRVTPQVTLPARSDSNEGRSTHAGTHPPMPRGPGRPKKTEKEQARDAQQALVNKKKEVGPGLDRGGSRLANDKRRLGFVDDEDFEEIVVKEE